MLQAYSFVTPKACRHNTQSTAKQQMKFRNTHRLTDR